MAQFKEFLLVALILVFSLTFAAFLFYIIVEFIKMLWRNLCDFLLKQELERGYMKKLRRRKEVEILIHNFPEFFGIPVVECAHRRKIRRTICNWSQEELETFVNPVLKLVDGKVVLAGGVVRRMNKRQKRRISAEEYLHYYDHPKAEPVVIKKPESAA